MVSIHPRIFRNEKTPININGREHDIQKTITAILESKYVRINFLTPLRCLGKLFSG